MLAAGLKRGMCGTLVMLAAAGAAFPLHNTHAHNSALPCCGTRHVRQAVRQFELDLLLVSSKAAIGLTVCQLKRHCTKSVLHCMQLEAL